MLCMRALRSAACCHALSQHVPLEMGTMADAAVLQAIVLGPAQQKEIHQAVLLPLQQSSIQIHCGQVGHSCPLLLAALLTIASILRSFSSLQRPGAHQIVCR